MKKKLRNLKPYFHCMLFNNDYYKYELFQRPDLFSIGLEYNCVTLINSDDYFRAKIERPITVKVTTGISDNVNNTLEIITEPVYVKLETL